ncbi:protein adenylyltransferase SelO-like [Pecten maximus]|uniref:protein adenylyltransferase SelO-like n=1 Tax=Pecten maximus TaxID=6579 RepID=UPI0014583D4E|nr:protein adenylyltransferase SelO-like [Pecten maximus]
MFPRVHFRFVLFLMVCSCLVHFAYTYLESKSCDLQYNKQCIYYDVRPNCIITNIDSGTCDVDKYTLASTLKDWGFNSQRNVILSEFPIDPVKKNYVRQVKNSLFSITYPVPLRSRTILAAISDDVLVNILDLDPVVVRSRDFTDFVSGSLVLHGAVPLAHRYGGHQFGSWAGQLGDGRAVMLGDYVNRKGERWELQLKGSGLTPYSRRGDGRAVIRSSVREFLCSEALYQLGVPTSRAASLVVSDDPVTRDQFYDGHPQTERAAVVLRISQSWFRFGSLEILAQNGEIDLLRQLTDFIIRRYFLDIDLHGANRYLELYSAIVEQTAAMIAMWQSVGFTHGVCNTDNFSILSLTIDFGPFGFLEEYNPKFVPNTSDDEGRYSYERQPDVGYYNLDKLKLALQPLLSKSQAKQMTIVLKGYVDIYKDKFMELFRRKIGLSKEAEEDEQVIAILLKMMEETKADFTMTFRQLSEISVSDIGEMLVLPGDQAWALKKLATHDWFAAWVKMYKKVLMDQNVSETNRQRIMKLTNPRYVLRNWMAQKAITKAERDDFSEIAKVLRVLERPFTFQEEAEANGFASPPPHWANTLRVSCSS